VRHTASAAETIPRRVSSRGRVVTLPSRGSIKSGTHPVPGGHTTPVCTALGSLAVASSAPVLKLTREWGSEGMQGRGGILGALTRASGKIGVRD
jgi:hypothetical protein